MYQWLVSYLLIESDKKLKHQLAQGKVGYIPQAAAVFFRRTVSICCSFSYRALLIRWHFPFYMNYTNLIVAFSECMNTRNIIWDETNRAVAMDSCMSYIHRTHLQQRMTVKCTSVGPCPLPTLRYGRQHV